MCENSSVTICMVLCVYASSSFMVDDLKSIIVQYHDFIYFCNSSACTTYGMAQTMNNCSCEGDIVSTIGRKPTTLSLDLSPPSDLSGLFLNTHSQAPCNGRVVAWEFCYYVLQDNDLITGNPSWGLETARQFRVPLPEQQLNRLVHSTSRE